ncbi:hepatic leukemia factor [Plakobranchus ocellatus]|uniref:Hepatic leukemia factor n=1 Tax=Plakobranchus ocellatus TaxID=259542 RepID=A0AAV4B0Y5_9GAST|nr:hepatic leukemia factor [Plakobranchus ocellatus]
MSLCDDGSSPLQGFEPNQYEHKANLSIATIISTSCVILDGSQESQFRYGNAQGAMAGAVATTTLLPSNRCDFDQGYPTQINQDTGENGFCSLSGLNNYSEGTNNQQTNNNFDSSLFEPEMYDFSWTGTSNANVAGHGVGHEEVVDNFFSNDARSSDDWPKDAHYECTKNRSLMPTGRTVQSDRNNGYVSNDASTLEEAASGLNRRKPELNFFAQPENLQMEPRECPTHNQGATDSGHNDVPCPNQFNQFENNSAWFQGGNYTFGDNFGYNWTQRCPAQSTLTNKSILHSNSFTSRSDTGFTQDHNSNTSSSYYSSSDTGDQGTTRTDESSSSFFAMNSKELVSARAEQIELGPYKMQMPCPSFGVSGESRTTTGGQRGFSKCSLQVHQSSESSLSGDGLNKDKMDDYDCSQIFDSGFARPKINSASDKPVPQRYCPRIIKDDGDANSRFPNNFKPQASVYGGKKSKQKTETVESLQRQLLLLEEQRNDAEADTSQTSEGRNALDNVEVDVDHMICSGITVAGFKPRATIRKRNKIAICNEDKDTGYWQKRRKNNDSARKSRESKKEKEKNFYKRALELEYENLYLQRCLRIAEAEMAAVGQTLVLPPLNSQNYF